MLKRLASWGLVGAAFALAVAVALLAPSTMTAASVRAVRQATGTPPEDHCCCCHQYECNTEGSPSPDHKSSGKCHDDEEGGDGGDGGGGDGDGDGDDDCGGDPNGGDGGGGGSNLGTGEIRYSTIDIASRGFAARAHTRSYQSRPFYAYQPAGQNGRGWGVAGWPELVQTGNGYLLAANGGRHHRSFQPAATRVLRFELVEPGRMSFTRIVPASVPSVFQSSLPWRPSSAVKKSRLPTKVKSRHEDPSPWRLISSTSVVPASVPSLLQGSLPCRYSASKRRMPPIATNWLGLP